MLNNVKTAPSTLAFRLAPVVIERYQWVGPFPLSILIGWGEMIGSLVWYPELGTTLFHSCQFSGDKYIEFLQSLSLCIFRNGGFLDKGKRCSIVHAYCL